MFLKDIDKVYTDIIAEYITKGWTVYTPSMGGSQGEKAKVDLLKGNNFVRVLLDTHYVKGGWNYTVSVGIKNFERSLYKDRYFSDIFWNDTFKIITEHNFYNIDADKRYFTDNFSFYQDCIDKRNKRFKLAFDGENKVFTNKKALNIAYKLCKRTRGYKTVKAKDILSIERTQKNVYKIRIKEKDNLIVNFNKNLKI